MNETNDSQKRIEEFMNRYGALVKELDVDLVNYPVFVPTEDNTFSVSIQVRPMDLRGDSVPSPFMRES